MSDRYAVLGNPVKHSRSPAIHALFARQTGQAVRYEALMPALDGFGAFVADLQARGLRGCNVTLPFKQEAWALATGLSEHARRAGAVNTLSFQPDGRIQGANTDGVGLVRDLQRFGIAPPGLRILLLGAGGASRGVLQPLLEQAPEQLHIANRTPEKARELAQAFAAFGAVSGGGYTALDGPFDLIINATAASIAGDLPPLPAGILLEGGSAYDMMYGAEPTPFMDWAQVHGAGRVLDGLGMLVEQAAESFYIWRGVRPETTSVLETVRSRL
ncbi:MAG: shikimate dehydrogenase [Thiothrix sp.]|nr:shikimate dehydrogenase [Thiothrix sp.]HPQ95845.1 shikimate dehydrogenase [Thiolinea sp.]